MISQNLLLRCVILKLDNGMNRDTSRMRHMELAEPVTIKFPSRWTTSKVSNPKFELAKLAETLSQGCEAISGLYMRMCDLVRSSGLTDDEVRESLCRQFPDSRISEIIRVSRSPEEIYSRYHAGFFGFRAALKECRGYQVTSSAELHARKARRAAERLVLLLGDSGSIRVRGRLVTIT